MSGTAGQETKPHKAPMSLRQKIGLPLALVTLLIIIFLPTPEGLPVAGHRMLALLVFSVILWMTEGVSYPVSAAVILSLMMVLLGTSPIVNPEADGKLYGMNAALVMGLGGFSNSAWALVAMALFLACAMQKTGFDRRLALKILSLVGTKSKNIVIGVILVGFALSFFVPSTTARVACIVPIIMGIITAFGVDKRGKFAGVLMIACAQADSIWNVGVKTAAAQNMIAVNFINQILGRDITWTEWFVAAAPFAVLMSIALYVTLIKLMPPEVEEFPGGKETVRKQLDALGPIQGPELKLMIVSICLLCFWILEGKTFGSIGIGGEWANTKIHPFNTASITVIAVTLFFLPGIGIMTWNEAASKINWGTIILFGIGISLGSAIIKTQAGSWLALQLVSAFGLASSSALLILAILSMFLIVIHLGFASATALASAMIPIVIAVLQQVDESRALAGATGLNILGMTMILQYVVSFGFILPVNAPQNMIAYGTGTFSVGDFVKTGVPLTLIAYLLIVFLGATYWKFLGYVI